MSEPTRQAGEADGGRRVYPRQSRARAVDEATGDPPPRRTRFEPRVALGWQEGIDRWHLIRASPVAGRTNGRQERPQREGGLTEEILEKRNGQRLLAPQEQVDHRHRVETKAGAAEFQIIAKFPAVARSWRDLTQERADDRGDLLFRVGAGHGDADRFEGASIA